MACRRLVELPKVAFLRLHKQPLAGSYIHHSFAYKTNAPMASTQCRYASNEPIQAMPAVPKIKENIFVKLRRYMGLPDYTAGYYRMMGVFIYEKIDALDISEILSEFKLDDTFYSWYLIMELHLWMLLSRASQHGKEGRIVKESLGTTMWEDVRRRIKLVVPDLPVSEQNKTLDNLNSEIEFALVLYDEAVLSDDRRLAEALWVRLYRGKTVDPIVLEKFVCYVRKQIRHLDLTPREEIILRANFTWLPVKKCRI